MGKNWKNNEVADDLDDWSYKVRCRDSFTCQVCNAIGVEMHGHHEMGKATFKLNELDIYNGIT